MSYKGWTQKRGIYTNPAYPGWEIGRDLSLSIPGIPEWERWYNGKMVSYTITLGESIENIQRFFAPEEVKQP